MVYRSHDSRYHVYIATSNMPGCSADCGGGILGINVLLEVSRFDAGKFNLKRHVIFSVKCC